MNRKILFLDIDNTLYSGKTGRVPESAFESIEKARNNGHLVFLCTGRSRAEAKRYLNYPVDGFIFGSGSNCVMGDTVIYDHPIAKEMVEEIESILNRMHMGVLMGGAEHAYLDDQCYALVENYFSRPEADAETKRRDMEENGMIRMKYRDFSDPIYKLGAAIPNADSFEPLIRVLPSPFRLIVTLHSPEGQFGDISDGSIMKKDGIEKVLNYCRMNRSDAIGIGDSGNDIDMLEYCGTGIAMGNGSAEIRKAADYVTTDIDDDGIRNAFLWLGVI